MQVIEFATIFGSAKEIYAGAIFLVLDQWVNALGTSLGINKNERGFGERVGKTHLAQLVSATANNFRHSSEWSEPDACALANIKILDDAGIHDVRDMIVAHLVLDVLDVPTYGALEAKVRVIGQEMLAQAKVKHVAEAAKLAKALKVNTPNGRIHAYRS